MSGKPIDEAVQKAAWAVETVLLRRMNIDKRLDGYTKEASEEMAEAALTAAQQQGQAVDCSDCTNSQQCDKCSRGEWETLPQPTQQGGGGGEVVAYQRRQDSALNGQWGPWAECSHDEYAVLARILSGRMEARIAGRLERGDLREDAAGWPTQIRALCVAAPPSAPVGASQWIAESAGPLKLARITPEEAWRIAYDAGYSAALAQQPAAVDGARVVETIRKALHHSYGAGHTNYANFTEALDYLATQHQEPKS